ncbi:SRPBCC family protein [Micromonospora sp. NPDC005173]|uniref:SRPBCC family protein n=1 Tax=Micromonospora sp. NPDC005173 TaxID=3157165 RepID=UPI0033ABFD4D
MGVDRDCTEVGDDFVRVTRTVNAPIGQVFEYVIDVDLSHIFPRFGHSPAILASSVTTGWNTPGVRRTNTSDDGSTNEEELLTVEPPNSFSYRVDNFSSQRLREVVDSIEGSWYFSDQEDDTTSIEWTYALNPVDEPARGGHQGGPAAALRRAAEDGDEHPEGRPRVLTTAPRTGAAPGGTAGPAPGVW